MKNIILYYINYICERINLTNTKERDAAMEGAFSKLGATISARSAAPASASVGCPQSFQAALRAAAHLVGAYEPIQC